MMDDDTESTHFFLARCEVGVVRVRSLLELPTFPQWERLSLAFKPRKRWADAVLATRNF